MSTLKLSQAETSFGFSDYSAIKPKSSFLRARPVVLDKWLELFETDFLPCVVVVPQSALCCFMFLVSDTGALLWRSQRGQRGYDRFTHHHHDDHCICGRLVCLSAVRKKKKLIFFPSQSIAATRLASLTVCHSLCLLFLQSSQKLPATKLESPSAKLEASSHTINIHRRKSICKVSFSLTTCSHLRWSIRPSLAANLTPALFHSLDWLLRSWPQRVTYEALGCPLAGPVLAPDAAEHRGAAVNSPDKRLSAPHSPLMSPTKRTESTLGPLGFIYPFFLAPAKSRLGRQVCQVPQLWPSDHITHSLWDSQRASCCILPIHVVGFHILPSPLKRYVCKQFLAGLNQPQSNLKKPSHVNAASQAQEWLKLKGRLSTLNPKMGIPVLLEILSSSFRKEEKEES